MEQPHSMYWKFRGIDANTFRMLANEELWFSHPSAFNDPFDTNLNLAELIADFDPPLPNRDELLADVEASRHDRGQYLDGRLLYCVTSGKDPVLGKKNWPAYGEVLMWSHYADQHRGVCLGMSLASVDKRLEGQGIRRKWQVYYGLGAMKARFRVANREHGPSGFGLPANRQAPAMLDRFDFVKAPAWAYENEHRFVVYDKSGDDRGRRGVAVPFSPKDLEHVVFGLKSSPEDRSAIQRVITTKDWGHVRFWEAKRGPGLFDLRAHPLVP
jgi:hypothetical protein